MTLSRREYELAAMTTDDVTRQWAAIAQNILLASGGLGLLISLLLLRLYRRALQRGMARESGKSVVPQDADAALTELPLPPPPLVLTWVNTAREECTGPESGALYSRA